MSTWNASQIASLVHGTWLVEPPELQNCDIEFAGVSIDTRELQPNQFFFAFDGEQTDGHAFLDQAATSGASLCIVTNRDKLPSAFTVSTLLVEDALETITKLAQAWRAKLEKSTKVIAITGSNGKTTTCRMIHAICSQTGKSYCSPKSFNNALGVPITILNTPIDSDYLISEVGTSSPGEIAARAELLKPHVAAITSIGRAHLEELKGRTGVAKEKASLIKALSDGSVAILPSGVAELDAALTDHTRRLSLLHIGTDQQADRTLSNIDTNTPQCSELMTSFQLDGSPFQIPLLGAHNASNASVAIEIARSLGIDDDTIQRGLYQNQAPEMRFAKVVINSTIIYNDAYNANPDSMRAALSTFDSIHSVNGKTAVLGDMLELGADSKIEHQSLCDDLQLYRSIEHVVLVGEHFAQCQLPQKEPIQSQSDQSSNRITIHQTPNAETMSEIASTIKQGLHKPGLHKPGSLTLLKGSRGIKLERIIDCIMAEQSTAHQSQTPAQTKETNTHA
jgi:UDP-N-acetylmuramoyl-tripeptide--D-alanyl-D-alanine ligase